MAEETRQALPPLDSRRASGGQGSEAAEPRAQGLRLLMEPERSTGRRRARRSVCRWVVELNGHPGSCGPDCWHGGPEAALRCFLGASSTATASRRDRHVVVA